MTITTEELEMLVKRSDSPKDHVRYEARDKLDAVAPDLARELLAARKVVEAARMVEREEWGTSRYTDDGMWGDAAALHNTLTAYDQACGGEG